MNNLEQEELVEPIDEVSEQQDAPVEDAPVAEPAPTPAEPAAEPVAEPVKGEEPPALSEEAQLAAEALAATEDQPVQPVQQGVPVAVIAEWRANRRADRQLIETLQAQLAERTKPAEPVAEPSPLEKWIAENPEDAEVSSAPAKIILAERQWQDRQVTVRVERQQVEQRKTLGQESYVKAKSAFTDFDTVVELGGQHLTPGNKLDIASSKDPAVQLYKLCIRATLDSGTADAAVMRQHLQSKLAKGSEPKKNQESKPGPAAQPVAKPVVKPAATRVHNPRLAQVLSTFDM